MLPLETASKLAKLVLFELIEFLSRIGGGTSGGLPHLKQFAKFYPDRYLWPIGKALQLS